MRPTRVEKVIIGGTRTFDDFDLLRETMDRLTRKFDKVEVVSGEWRGIGYGTPAYVGADLLGEKWAAERKFVVKRFCPPFHKFPGGIAKKHPGAFHIRNRAMAQYAGPTGFACVFWDGESDGTKSLIKECLKVGVQLKIVRYE